MTEKELLEEYKGEQIQAVKRLVDNFEGSPEDLEKALQEFESLNPEELYDYIESYSKGYPGEVEEAAVEEAAEEYGKEQLQEAKKIIETFKGTPEELQSALEEFEALDDRYIYACVQSLKEQDKAERQLQEASELFSEYDEDRFDEYSRLLLECNENLQRALIETTLSGNNWIKKAMIDEQVFGEDNAGKFLSEVCKLAEEFEIDITEELDAANKIVDAVFECPDNSLFDRERLIETYTQYSNQSQNSRQRT